jgi:glutamate-1-semialdehyde 2,1-aminomutase
MIAEAFTAAGAPGQVTGMGSLFRIHTTDRVISDYRQSYASTAEKQQMEWLWRYLLNHGILINKMGFGALSTVTSEAEIELFSETLYSGLLAMRSEGIAAE